MIITLWDHWNRSRDHAASMLKMFAKDIENFFKSVQFNRQSHDTMPPNRHLALVGRKNSPFPERNLWQMFLREGHSCVGQIINTLELCRTAQGTNNMHNCPNSDALQVFFYPKQRTSWHKLRRSISDNIPVRFSKCDSNFLWVYKVFKISPFVNRRTFPLFQLALTHPSHHLNFGMNPDHARNSLSNCGIRQPKYGDRKVHHMYMRKKGLYFNVFLL